MANKHLVVTAQLNIDRRNCTITIVETPIGIYTDFSAKGMSHEGHHTGVFKFEDVLLIRVDWFISSYNCDSDLVDESYDKFHKVILGTTDSFVMPSDKWPIIKKAIEAYNEWGATQ